MKPGKHSVGFRSEHECAKVAFQKIQNGGNYTETEDHEIQNIRKSEQNLQSTYHKSDPAQGI